MTKKCRVKHSSMMYRVFGDVFHYFDLHLDGVLSEENFR